MNKRLFRLFVYILALGLAACTRSYQPVYTPPQASGIQIDSSIAPDSIYLAAIAPYKVELDKQINQVIGRAARTLTKGSGESLLGNFVADLTQIQAQKYGQQPVDMGLVADGGLRVPINAGEIKVNHIFELMPFENRLWVLTLPGTTVQKLFDEVSSRPDLSVSNSQVIVQNGKAVDVRIGGKPLDKDKNYRLATTDYMALGGSHLPFLKEAIETKDVNILYRDAIIDYIQELTRQGKPVDAQIENRIIRQ